MKKKPNILIVTETEPFYMADCFRYFFSHHLPDCRIVSAFILNYFRVGPADVNGVNYRDMLKAFGLLNFSRSLLRIFQGKLMPSKQVGTVFKANGIPVHNNLTNINAPEVVKKIQAYQPDVIVAVGVNSLFRKPLRQAARLGCINIHSGIKPEHRGKASIFWALADGSESTGVTAHEIDEGIDTGNIILTRDYSIQERSLDKVLYDLRILSMDVLLEALQAVSENQAVLGVSQQIQKAELRPYPCLNDFYQFIERGNRLF